MAGPAGIMSFNAHSQRCFCQCDSSSKEPKAKGKERRAKAKVQDKTQLQAAKSAEEAAKRLPDASRLPLPLWHLALGALPFLALALLWLSVIRLLGAQWSVYDQYKYGWAVPVLCLYFTIARCKKQRVKSEEQGATGA